MSVVYLRHNVDITECLVCLVFDIIARGRYVVSPTSAIIVTFLDVTPISKVTVYLTKVTSLTKAISPRLKN